MTQRTGGRFVSAHFSKRGAALFGSRRSPRSSGAAHSTVIRTAAITTDKTVAVIRPRRHLVVDHICGPFRPFNCGDLTAPNPAGGALHGRRGSAKISTHSSRTPTEAPASFVRGGNKAGRGQTSTSWSERFCKKKPLEGTHRCARDRWAGPARETGPHGKPSSLPHKLARPPTAAPTVPPRFGRCRTAAAGTGQLHYDRVRALYCRQKERKNREKDRRAQSKMITSSLRPGIGAARSGSLEASRLDEEIRGARASIEGVLQEAQRDPRV